MFGHIVVQSHPLSLEINNTKFRKLVGVDARAETMERELERVSR